MRAVSKARVARQERRAAIERQLLEATERLMNTGLAFTELSVERLATEAGISRASFYLYFDDKGQLLLTLADRVFTELAAAARLWWDRADQHRPSDAYAAISETIATFRRNQAIMRAVLEMATYDPDVEEIYRALLDRNTEGLVDIIDRGMADGTISPVDTRTTASVVMWMVERACHQLLRRDSPESDDQLARAITEIAWRTLYLKSAGDLDDAQRTRESPACDTKPPGTGSPNTATPSPRGTA